jgi:hypothetical protein
MSELQRVTMFKLERERRESRGKKRTLKDTLLISAWVAGYAGVLIVFRAARFLESRLSSRQKERGTAEAMTAKMPLS